MRVKIHSFIIITVTIFVSLTVLGNVIITDMYKINVTSENPKIYLALGPDYLNYNNIISVINSTTSGIDSQTIYMTNITSTNSVQMLNVLEIYNETGWDKNMAPVYVYINVSNLNHISLGVSQYQVTSFLNATNITGTFIMHILNPGPVIYLSFDIWGYNSTLWNAGTIYIYYYIT